VRLIFRRETFPCRSSLGWNLLFPTDNCLFQSMSAFAFVLSFTYLKFSSSVDLSMNKCREPKYLPRSPHRIGHLLLIKALNLSSRLVIPACHVHQKVLRSTRSLVIHAVDGTLRNKLNKKLVGLYYPRFLFCFVFSC